MQVDSEWVMRFNAILEVLRRLLLIAAVLLGIGVLAVIGNTIRLEIQGRRAEIEVTKLVGGSNAFVRRPFLYTGVLYGLGGALLAWGIVALAVLVLRDSVATLAHLYGSRYRAGGTRAPGHRGAAGCRGWCWAGSARGSRPPGTCAASNRAPEAARAADPQVVVGTAAPVQAGSLPSTCARGAHRRRGCACRRSSAARSRPCGPRSRSASPGSGRPRRCSRSSAPRCPSPPCSPASRCCGSCTMRRPTCTS